VTPSDRHLRGEPPAEPGLREAAAKLREVSLRLVSRLRSQARIEAVEMTMVEQEAERVRVLLDEPPDDLRGEPPDEPRPLT
jgi:hypothetical protein